MGENIAALDQNRHETFACRFEPFRAFAQLIIPFFVVRITIITQVVYWLRQLCSETSLDLPAVQFKQRFNIIFPDSVQNLFPVYPLSVILGGHCKITQILNVKIY